MIETFSAYWQFLKKPQLLKLATDKTKVWKDMFWLLVLHFAFAILINLIHYLLLKFKLIVSYESFDLFQFGFILAMVLGAVAVPLAEEVLFRWQLRKPKVSLWFILLSLGCLISSFTGNKYVGLAIFTCLFVIGLMIHSRVEKWSRMKTILVFRKYYVFLFYYTAIIFGYIHISNMKRLTLADPSFIIYISSQILGGLGLGYIRVKYGLVYSILMHAAFNGVLILLY